MQTPIGRLVSDFVDYTFNTAEYGLNMFSRFVPKFVYNPIHKVFSGTRGFSQAVLESSDSRFVYFSNMVQKYFPGQYAWMTEKTNNLSATTRQRAKSIEESRQRLASRIDGAYNSLRDAALKKGEDVKMVAHPYVHSAAVITEPYVHMAMKQAEPVWIPLSHKAKEVNERIVNTKFIGPYVKEFETVASRVMNGISTYCYTEDLGYDTSPSVPSEGDTPASVSASREQEGTSAADGGPAAAAASMMRGGIESKVIDEGKQQASRTTGGKQQQKQGK